LHLLPEEPPADAFQPGRCAQCDPASTYQASHQLLNVCARSDAGAMRCLASTHVDRCTLPLLAPTTHKQPTSKRR
jgi:hypothetical protein